MKEGQSKTAIKPLVWLGTVAVQNDECGAVIPPTKKTKAGARKWRLPKADTFTMIRSWTLDPPKTTKTFACKIVYN
jgi:hypothetical protein